MTREEAISIMSVIVHMLEPQYDTDRIEDAVEMAIKALEQEPKAGRWIPVGYDGYADGNPVYDWWECSECGWEHTGDEDTLTPYCPNCGAEMKEGE